MYTEYQNENNQLLKFVLNTAILDSMKSNENKNSDVEFFVTPECNLKCEYCYVNKHRNSLYPNNIIDHTMIKKNLISILNWFGENNYYPRKINIFSGEIWDNKFGYEILSILYDFLSINKITTQIVIPTNMSFVVIDKYKEQMQLFIDKFNAIGVRLTISASIDGKVIDDKFRQFKDLSSRTDEYYDRIFEFCSKNRFGLHPMLFSKSSKYWIENYQWFETMKKKHNISRDIMLLEVRNDDWTEEDISYYLDFLNWVFEYKQMNFEKFLGYIFNTNKDRTSYNPLILKPQIDRIGCSIQHTMMVRLGDLSILPCHRTSYDQFIYGKFIKENEKIVDIQAYNAELALEIYSMNPAAGHPKCDTCKYRKLCIKQCLGAEYEANSELFSPCNSVCLALKSKINLLLKLYNDYGIIDGLKVNQNNAQLNHLYKLYTELL